MHSHKIMATLTVLHLLAKTTMALAEQSPLNTSNPSKTANISGDLQLAIDDMQAGTYYTFVTLVQMLGDGGIPHDITFLMPSDEMLGQVIMAENVVSDFLMRHAIPRPLLYDNMLQFPTGSLIPTSLPHYMLQVSNDGGSSLSLNNVRIITPDICRLSPSFRCHGVSGVLDESASATDPPSSNSEGRQPCSAILRGPATANVSHVRSPHPVSSPSPFAGPLASSINFTAIGAAVMLVHNTLVLVMMTCVMLALADLWL